MTIPFGEIDAAIRDCLRYAYNHNLSRSRSAALIDSVVRDALGNAGSNAHAEPATSDGDHWRIVISESGEGRRHVFDFKVIPRPALAASCHRLATDQ